jgi:hypothetical protein
LAQSAAPGAHALSCALHFLLLAGWVLRGEPGQARRRTLVRLHGFYDDGMRVPSLNAQASERSLMAGSGVHSFVLSLTFAFQVRCVGRRREGSPRFFARSCR